MSPYELTFIHEPSGWGFRGYSQKTKCGTTYGSRFTFDQVVQFALYWRTRQPIEPPWNDIDIRVSENGLTTKLDDKEKLEMILRF